jgi:hypothetical protein
MVNTKTLSKGVGKLWWMIGQTIRDWVLAFTYIRQSNVAPLCLELGSYNSAFESYTLAALSWFRFHQL